MHRFPLPLFGFILVLACASNAESQTDKVRVAISSISTSQVNVWVPFDTGFFKKHGLDVELVYISGAPIGAAALMSGEVAISQGGVGGSITSNMRGSGTYIILGGADRFPLPTDCRAEYQATLRFERQTFPPCRASARPITPRPCLSCQDLASSRTKK